MPDKLQNVNIETLLTLSVFGKIGPRGFAKLLAQNPLFDAASLTTPNMIKAGIKPEIANEFIQFRSQFDGEAELARLKAHNITLVSASDSAYPLLLKEISDPPYLLYVLGSLDGLQRQSLAVVGSRKHTHYGTQIIERVVPEVVQQGVTIVSGLALGIDALAHVATLKAGGVTVAVIGCGLDVIYPSEHRVLAERIVQNGGAIVSEYPLGTAPLKQHFPARNRIISGVSQGTLVVECDVKSGAMITAHHALDQNRDVYAVPGPITSISSGGPNALLRMGAHVVTSPTDLLEMLGLQTKAKSGKVHKVPVATGLAPHERLVYEAIGEESVHIDSLPERCRLEMAEVSSALLFLEMKGLVHNIGAATYARR